MCAGPAIDGLNLGDSGGAVGELELDVDLIAAEVRVRTEYSYEP